MTEHSSVWYHSINSPPNAEGHIEYCEAVTSLNKGPQIPLGHIDHLENMYSYKNKNTMPSLGYCSIISKQDL